GPAAAATRPTRAQARPPATPGVAGPGGARSATTRRPRPPRRPRSRPPRSLRRRPAARAPTSPERTGAGRSATRRSRSRPKGSGSPTCSPARWRPTAASDAAAPGRGVAVRPRPPAQNGVSAVHSGGRGLGAAAAADPDGPQPRPTVPLGAGVEDAASRGSTPARVTGEPVAAGTQRRWGKRTAGEIRSGIVTSRTREQTEPPATEPEPIDPALTDLVA